MKSEQGNSKSHEVSRRRVLSRTPDSRGAGSSRSSATVFAAGPPNNPIKLSVHPVTHLALARCAPVWPAAYRVRYVARGEKAQP